jgi:hypothetical protein
LLGSLLRPLHYLEVSTAADSTELMIKEDSDGAANVGLRPPPEKA